MTGFGLTLIRELAKVSTAPQASVPDNAGLELTLRCGKDGTAIRTTLTPITGGYAVRTIRRVDPGSTTSSPDASAPSSERTIPVDLIQWSKEKCPCCAAKIAPIRCGKCGALVCDATRSMRNGRAWFTCVPACGAEGAIKIGLIDARVREASPETSALMLPSGSAPKLGSSSAAQNSQTGRGGG